MRMKVVVMLVDDEALERDGHDFESELGWLRDSHITAERTYEIPAGLEDRNPIEVLYLLQHIEDCAEMIQEEGFKITEAIKVDMLKNFIGNTESIDQDMDWKIRDFLNDRYQAGLTT